MDLLGVRLKNRRRQMQLHQKDVAGPNSASFLSKVENGLAQPSLKNLGDWAQKMETTSADLLGDHLALEAAKLTILNPKICASYLDQLPASPVTIFLKELSTSSCSLSTPVPSPPRDNELEYLTAKVLLHRGDPPAAAKIEQEALDRCQSQFWRILHLSLLHEIFGRLGDEQMEKQARADLKEALRCLDYNELLQALPHAEALSSDDLGLVRLALLHSLWD